MSNTIPASNLLFNYEDLASDKDKATRTISKSFEKHHCPIAQVDVDAKAKRTSGINYREMNLVFADSQTVTLRIKQSGDVFQVLINKKLTPIKHQDNHEKAVIEIVNILDASRVKWQKKLAALQIEIPKGIKTPAPKMLEVLTAKRDGLKEVLTDLQQEIAQLKGVTT
ncbi:hypothetical protein [Methylocucumis oryzae]|uniref:Defence against restriction A N-terminal domain-containing protein n=1 Tax=Methylocucumis oryzae TaxID=1632867 RepID=A0A0F3IR57_9GAMM|nr:hypothetical protein [Methylocucumis oryzae]KJV08069.1 hypothetical protein VZ94_00480 [Methylocucumis oryzae]